jgi:hypothetical protein
MALRQHIYRCLCVLGVQGIFERACPEDRVGVHISLVQWWIVGCSEIVSRAHGGGTLVPVLKRKPLRASLPPRYQDLSTQRTTHSAGSPHPIPG